jgi:putative xylitol transport system permease protein
MSSLRNGNVNCQTEASSDKQMGVFNWRTGLLNFVQRLGSRYGIVLALLLIVLVLGLSTDSFLTAGNLTNVLRQVSINGILAVGMTFVILTGGIDLSVGSLLALTGMVAASLAAGIHVHAPITSALAAMAVGTALGACSGVLIAWVRLPVLCGHAGNAECSTRAYLDLYARNAHLQLKSKL